MTPRAPVPHVVRARGPARRSLGRALERLAGVVALPLALAGALAAFLASRSTISVGVEVLTGSRPGPGDNDVAPAATYFVVGQAERGDVTNEILVRSLGEYTDLLGSRVSYGALYDDLDTFFAEGGSRAYVARVVGPAATVGSRTLVDRAGSPLNTLRIDAANPGAWSSGVTVEVQNGTVANTFRLIIRYGTTTDTFDNLASPVDAVTALANHRLVRATNLASATAAPNNNPAVLAATALTAGTDDRASIVAGTYTAALARFTPDLGSGAVGIPGQAATTIEAAVRAHCIANRRVALLAPVAGADVATANGVADGLRGTAGQEGEELVYPWVQIPDGVGGVRTISPEGYAAAKRAVAHATVGPWRIPAGNIALARRVIGTERNLTQSDIDSLFDHAISPIRSDAGGVRLYGARSLSADRLNFQDITDQDTLNFVAVQAGRALDEVVFQPIDSRGHLYKVIETKLTGILQPMADADGLYAQVGPDGTTLVDPGFIIDFTANTPQVVQQRRVIVDIGIRVTPGADLVTVRVVKVAVGTGF